MTATNHTTKIEAQIIDPCTPAGFADIAATFGIESAFTAKINALKAKVEEGRRFRWSFISPERELFDTQFDFAWYLAKGEPARCKQIVADLRGW